MTKTNLFLKKTLALFFCLLMISACGKSDQAKVKEADGGEGGAPLNEKLGLAPAYEVSQFKAGQWIEWKRYNGDKFIDCYRWTWTNFFSEGIKIEGRSSKTCTEPSNNYETEIIVFNPENGAVISHQYEHQGAANTAGYLKSIFARIYGNPKQIKETYTLGKVTNKANVSYPAFQLKNAAPNIAYLNQPGSPFHAVAIGWNETHDSTSWRYEINSSKPSIEVLPKDSQSAATQVTSY